MKREIVIKGSSKDSALTQHVKKGGLDRQAYDYMVKVIIVGDSGVGKTNIISRYCCKEGEQGEFRDYHVATIGVDFSTKVIKVNGKRLKLQIWDTAGQQRFRTITQTYYKGAGGIILVYSVDSQESFLNIQNWMKQIDQKSTESVLKVLVANKIDVEDDYSEQFYQDQPRKISSQRGRALAQRYGLDYYEVSAKNNQVGLTHPAGDLKDQHNKKWRIIGFKNPDNKLCLYQDLSKSYKRWYIIQDRVKFCYKANIVKTLQLLS